jgi:hypothetical protein
MYKSRITEALFVQMTPRDGKYLNPVTKIQLAFYSFNTQIYGTELHVNRR